MNLPVSSAASATSELAILSWNQLLVYPQGYTPGQRVPLLLNVHGGPAGVHTNTFTPASRLYPSARQSPYATFDLVAAALVADEVDRGVLPIENSLAGPIPEHCRI